MRSEAVSNPRTGRALLVALMVALGALMLATFASPAQADVLKVTNKRDSGVGSLRNAINNAAPRGDTIVFASTVRGTITLRSDGLYVDKNLTIKGPGAGKLTINGNNDNRVFYVDDGKNVQISGLAIAEGFTSGYSGGGIENDGNLTLAKCVVSNNDAGGYYGGGGVYNTNVLTLIDSVVSSNFADKWGGGIYNSGTLVVERSTVSGNRSAYGGGIYSATDAPKKTTIANSTISGNSISSATGAGGGVYNRGGLTEIKNSTITDNTAPDGQGGGVFSNDAYRTTTEVFSTIIALNDGGFNSFDTFVSKGYNIIGSGAPGVTSTFNKTGDRVAVSNPGLGPLAANGGPTMTHALQSGSPAINTGSPNCPATDQRGAKRPYGGRCDTGSFEFGASPS